MTRSCVVLTGPLGDATGFVSLEDVLVATVSGCVLTLAVRGVPLPVTLTYPSPEAANRALQEILQALGLRP